MILRQRASQLGRICISPPTAFRRPFAATAAPMVEAKDLSPSPGEDADALAAQTTELVDQGRWRVCNDGKGLERAFRFKTFKTTWEFMNTIAAECKTQKHHPEWTNIYNRTHIRWTTHNPEGLSGRDVRMARFCDEVALRMGEVMPEPGEGEKSGPVWAAEAKECCAGKG